MLTDYHSHVLPAMDDGARSPGESSQMLDMWAAQGVERLIATPHYYMHREPAEVFLARRDNSVKRLPVDKNHPRVIIGSEVYIDKGISKIELIPQLTLAGSKYIMLELPYTGFSRWMLGEAQNIMHNYSLTPVFAHIERYTQWYPTTDMVQILSIPDVIWQINHSSLQFGSTRKFILELIRDEFPIVFGSDAHNTSDRAPNAAAAYRFLRSKLTKSQYIRLMELNESLL